MFEFITNLFGGGSENAGNKRITAKDIQENLSKISERCKWIDDQINYTLKEMDYTDQSTSEGLEKYEKLSSDLQKLQEVYKLLQEQMKNQLEILKKYKDSRFYIQPKDVLVITCVGGLAFFMICLDRESPKAVKLSSFILKLFPIRI